MKVSALRSRKFLLQPQGRSKSFPLAVGIRRFLAASAAAECRRGFQATVASMRIPRRGQRRLSRSFNPHIPLTSSLSITTFLSSKLPMHWRLARIERFIKANSQPSLTRRKSVYGSSVP
jgi:hypothetical protein